MTGNLFLYGIAEQNDLHQLIELEQSQTFARAAKIEQQTATAFLKMQQAASAEGIKIAICSGYRSFERQAYIWNKKATGERQLLDVKSRPITHFSKLTPNQIIDYILLWSALPGMSRHHWGTDIDLFDAATISLDDLKLINSEYELGGPCFKLAQWLNKNAIQFGFYRPFQSPHSGVTPELWHYSYLPVSKNYLPLYSTNSLRNVLINSDIALKEAVLPRLSSLVNKYVNKIAPYPSA